MEFLFILDYINVQLLRIKLQYFNYLLYLKDLL